MKTEIETRGRRTKMGRLGSLLWVASVFLVGLASPVHAQNPLDFTQRTSVSGVIDWSLFFGSPNFNFDRTKAVGIADINGDGYPDILDGNSNSFVLPNVVSFFETAVVLRLNNQIDGFDSVELVSLVSTTDFPLSGDVALADLNGDGLPDLVRSERTLPFEFDVVQLRVHLNQGSGTFFDLASTDYFDFLPPCPAFAIGDLNGDTFPDIAITTSPSAGTCPATSNSSGTLVLLNDGTGTDFVRLPALNAPQFSTSESDIILLDANHDGNLDILSIFSAPFEPTQLFINNGAASPSFSLDSQPFLAAQTGAAGDFNGDGYADFALGSGTSLAVYLNDPINPGTFAVQLPAPTVNAVILDLDVGDIDDDGDIDILGGGSTLGAAGGQGLLWLNNGDGTAFQTITQLQGGPVFPGHANFERTSASLIDFDLDGDLDAYFAGGDTQATGYFFGHAPNQFFENLTDPPGQ